MPQALFAMRPLYLLERGLAIAIVNAQHREHFVAQFDVVRTLRVGQAHAGVVGQMHSSLENLLELLPTLRSHAEKRLGDP